MGKRWRTVFRKGQMVYLEAADAFGFFGSPWITRLDQLERLSLTVSDFAIHDSVTDFLVLIHSGFTRSRRYLAQEGFPSAPFKKAVNGAALYHAAPSSRRNVSCNRCMSRGSS